MIICTTSNSSSSCLQKYLQIK